MTSETASFTDPQFLATFGVSRINALEYFLHPLNPFRTKSQTINEVLAMQGISIGNLVQGIGQHQSEPLPLERAEEEYHSALSRLDGEQYELLPPPLPPKMRKGNATAASADEQMNMDPLHSPLFTIRHVLRSKSKAITLGIYYILQGIIYKSPTARALMKYNVARTCQGLIDVCDTLSVCTNYTPTTGQFWDFTKATKPISSGKGDRNSSITNKKRTRDLNETKDEIEIYKQLRKIKKTSTTMDKKRRPEQRTDEEEERIRAKDKMNAILIRMSKSALVKGL